MKLFLIENDVHNCKTEKRNPYFTKEYGFLFSVVLCSVIFACGCAMLQSPLSSPINTGFSLPGRHAVTRGQLAFHSDFPLADEPLLNDMAACRDEVGRTLGLPESDEPIHVYVFENAEKYASFMRLRRPGFLQSRAGFKETENRLEVYVQWGERAARDMRHEIVHGCIHSVTPNAPLWLDEGLAEYFEMPGGVGGNREHLDRLVSKLRAGEWRPDLPRLESLRPGDEMSGADYAESWAWVSYLLHSGDRQRSDLPGTYLRQLRQNGRSEPLSSVLARINERESDEVIMYVQRLAQGD